MITLNTQQLLKENLFILSRYFTFFISSFAFLLSLFKLSCAKKHHVYNLYCISYTWSFCYVMFYIVAEICIGVRLLEDCFYCYSQQIISTVANESIISYNLIKKAPKTQNLYCCTTKCQPKPNQM